MRVHVFMAFSVLLSTCTPCSVLLRRPQVCMCVSHMCCVWHFACGVLHVCCVICDVHTHRGRGTAICSAHSCDLTHSYMPPDTRIQRQRDSRIYRPSSPAHMRRVVCGVLHVWCVAYVLGDIWYTCTQRPRYGRTYCPSSPPQRASS